MFGMHIYYNNSMEKRGKETYGKERYEKKEECKFGLSCTYLLEKRCGRDHEPGDEKLAQQYQTLIKAREIVLCYSQKPILVGGELLDFEISPSQAIKLQLGYYYFCSIQLKKRQIKIEINREVCPFGNLTGELALLSTFQPYLYYQPTKIKPEFLIVGKCKIRNGAKYLTSERPFPQDLKETVSYAVKFPILKDAIVEFQVMGKKIRIQSIKNPKVLLLFGILKCKWKGLTFVPYDPEIDQMLVQTIEDELMKHIGLNHYSFLLNYQKSNLQNLGGFHVRGKFLQWPSESSKPLISLYPGYYQNSIVDIKESILFVNEIQPKFSKQDFRQSDKIVQKGGNYKSKYHKDNTKLKVFTVDSPSTKIFDDAFSIEEKNEKYLVAIHVADVAEYIKAKTELDKSAKKKNSTVYIKNYRFPMLPDKLGKLLSLKSKQQKLACSLFFEMNSEGLIDMSTLRFQQTTINVDKNLSYFQFDQIIKRQQASGQKSLQLLFNKRSQLRQSKLIDIQSKGQNMVENLMVCSSELINYLYTRNLERITKFKDSIQDKMDEVIKEQSKNLIEMQKQKTEISKIKKDLNKASNNLKKEKKSFQKQLKDKQLKLKAQLTKSHLQKSKSKKEKGSKDEAEEARQQQLIDQQTVEDSLDDIILAGEQETKEPEEVKQEKEGQNLIKELLDQIQSPAKQKAKKQRQQQSEQQEIIIVLGEKVKKAAAQRARHFIQKIFDYFGVEFDCKHMNSIVASFKNLAKQKSENHLFKDYLERIKIRNYQYFSFLTGGKKEREQKKKDGPRYQKRNLKLEQNQKKQKDTAVQEKADGEGKKKPVYKAKIDQSNESSKKVEINKIDEDIKQIDKQAFIKDQENVSKQVSKKQEKQIETKQIKGPQRKQNKQRRQENKHQRRNKKKDNKDQKGNLDVNTPPQVIQRGSSKQQSDPRPTIEKKISKKQKKQQNRIGFKGRTEGQKKQYKTKKQEGKEQGEDKDITNDNLQKQNDGAELIKPTPSLNQIYQDKKAVISLNPKQQCQSILQLIPQGINLKSEVSPDTKNFVQQKEQSPEAEALKQLKKEITKQLKILEIEEQQKFSKLTQQLALQVQALQKQEKLKLSQLIESVKKLEDLVYISQIFDKKDFIINSKLIKMIKVIKEIIKFVGHKIAKKKDFSQVGEIINRIFGVEFQALEKDLLKSNKASVQGLSHLQKYQFLSWNNPIRDYSSLTTQRLLKQYRWFFHGSLQLMDVIQYYSDLVDIKRRRKEILSWNKERILICESSKDVKTANIAIEKVDFIEKIRKNPKQILTFLIVSSTGVQKTKVFHPILDEIQSNTHYKGNELYVQVKGTVIIESDFPLVLKVVLA